jgi:hypothetical protein
VGEEEGREVIDHQICCDPIAARPAGVGDVMIKASAGLAASQADYFW